MEEITLNVKLKTTITEKGRTIRLRIADCIASSESENGTKIEIGGTVGGGYEVHVGSKTFYASAEDIWNAIADQFDLEKVD